MLTCKHISFQTFWTNAAFHLPQTSGFRAVSDFTRELSMFLVAKSVVLLPSKVELFMHHKKYSAMVLFCT